MAKRKLKSKRYFLNVIEEMVMNLEYQWGRGGRIEVYDRENKQDGYAVYEARWFVPKEAADAFREVWDFKEFDHLPNILFDMEGELKKNG